MSAMIKSIVAFDLETTSLPQYDGFLTKITEMSCVACSVEHLTGLKEPAETIPRVVHKLSVCFNPHKRIEVSATSATGLDNDVLQNDNTFTENSGNLIKSYLGQLQQPVCLIAHNGDNFDFPILAKQLKSVNVTLSENVFCLDSLRAFREIDAINTQKIINDMIQLQEVSKNLIDKKDLTKTEDEESDNENENKNVQQINETTPKRSTDNSKTKRKLFCDSTTTTTRDSSPKRLSEIRPSFNTPKRQLFPATFVSPSTKPPNNPNQYRRGYKLGQLYRRFFKKQALVKHQAEADALLLLQCIAFTKDDFIPFMNEDAVLFSKIKPLGT